MIRIVDYDSAWPAAFADEASRLRTALGNVALRIDHHGSTAVPGLAAKPIIDIQISVANLQPLSVYGSKLEAIGYLHVPSADDSFCPFFHRPAQWPHTHHVHVVERGGDEERRTLAFRDYLRNHPAVAREYEALKRTIAAQVTGADPASREQYAVAKSDFVERIVALAIAQGLSAIEYGHDLTEDAMVSVKSDVTVEMLDAFAEAWNRHDADALMAFMSDDCVFESSVGPDICGTRFVGRDAVRAGFVEVWTNFPDAHWGNARHFVHGDRGVSEWIFTGTRTDGSRVEVHGCDLFSFRGGKITLKNSFRKNRL